MNILDILRKIGILRYGGTFYKGDASDRKIEFIQGGVMNSEKDNSTTEDLKKGAPVARILIWVFGVSFIVILLAILFS